MNSEIQNSIEQALSNAGWTFDREALIAPGRYKLTGDSIRERTSRADFLLRHHGQLLAVVEVVSDSVNLAAAMVQAATYARQINLSFAIATDGSKWSLLDFTTGKKESLEGPPRPEELLSPTDAELMQSPWGKAIAAQPFVDNGDAPDLGPHQEQAISAILRHFANGNQRASISMPPHLGMKRAVFQLAWKMLATEVLKNRKVLFVSNRLDQVHQAYHCFEGFGDSRCLIERNAKLDPSADVYFATVQTLARDGGAGPSYQEFDSEYFDLIIFDDCRAMMGSWSGVLAHFDEALQLGMMTSPETKAIEHFGQPVFSYSLRQAVEDGYLVPFMLQSRPQRTDAQSEDSLMGGKLERLIVAEQEANQLSKDIWSKLSRIDEAQQKTIVFCINNSHAALVAKKLNQAARDPSFAVHISASQANDQELIDSFRNSDESGPRVAAVVNLLIKDSIPDVSNIVLARPVASSTMRTNLIATGALPCDAIGKRFCTVFDYYGVLRGVALDFEWLGTRENPKELIEREGPSPEQVADEALPEEFQSLAKLIRELSKDSVAELFKAWTTRDDRAAFLDALEVHSKTIDEMKQRPWMAAADEIDVLACIGFDLLDLPSRKDRVSSFWRENSSWLRSTLGLEAGDDDQVKTNSWKLDFWTIALDHYSLYGIDSLEHGRTYQQSPFVNQFGSFQTLTRKYGGAQKLREDLEAVKRKLFAQGVVAEGDFE